MEAEKKNSAPPAESEAEAIRKYKEAIAKAKEAEREYRMTELDDLLHGKSVVMDREACMQI